MQYNYYLGTGVEAESLIERCKEKLEKRKEAWHALYVKYGCDILRELRGKVVCLGFKKKPDDWNKWLAGEEIHYDGDTKYYCYRPRMNTKRGKALASDIDAPDAVFDHSKFLVKELGIDHMTFCGNVAACSVAGFNGNTIVAKIPYGDGYTGPKIPEWFREVTLTEFNEVNNANN